MSISTLHDAHITKKPTRPKPTAIARPSTPIADAPLVIGCATCDADGVAPVPSTLAVPFAYGVSDILADAIAAVGKADGGIAQVEDESSVAVSVCTTRSTVLVSVKVVLADVVVWPPDCATSVGACASAPWKTAAAARAVVERLRSLMGEVEDLDPEVYVLECLAPGDRDWAMYDDDGLEFDDPNKSIVYCRKSVVSKASECCGGE